MGVGDRRLEDPPLLIEGVGAAEATRVARHRVLQEPLVRPLPLAEDVLEGHLEVDGPTDHLVAGRLGLEVEHHTVVVTEPEAQVVGVRRRRSRR